MSDKVLNGWRVMLCTSSVQREGDRWEVYSPEGSGGVVSTHDVRDWAVRGLLDALAGATTAKDSLVVAAQSAPSGEREAFEAKYPAANKLEFRGGVYLNRLGSELPRSVRDGINDAWVDFQAGAAWQRTQAEWIPVSERLPSVAQEVIVNSEFDGITAGFLDSYGEWYAPNSDYKLTRVVAWQQLPAAPALAASAEGVKDE